jgi:hypothetical protein
MIKTRFSTNGNVLALALFAIILFWWMMLMPYLPFWTWISVGPLLLSVFILLFVWIRDKTLLESVTKSDRGTWSERKLVLKLLKHGIPGETIFHDLYVKKHNGHFSQVDLLVVSNVGVIVFEVKDYGGWIFGNGDHLEWTQVFAYGKKSYRFYNPVKQNYAHINALMQNKNLENLPFYSVIVFYGKCALKTISNIPHGTVVIKSNKVLEIVDLISKINAAAPYADRQAIINVLNQAVKNGENKQVRSQHVENIEAMLRAQSRA